MRGARIEVHDPGLKIEVGHRGNPGQTDTWPPVSGIFSQSLGLRGAPVLCDPRFPLLNLSFGFLIL